jgi:hypothetical protein
MIGAPCSNRRGRRTFSSRTMLTVEQVAHAAVMGVSDDRRHSLPLPFGLLSRSGAPRVSWMRPSATRASRRGCALTAGGRWWPTTEAPFGTSLRIACSELSIRLIASPGGCELLGSRRVVRPPRAHHPPAFCGSGRSRLDNLRVKSRDEATSSTLAPSSRDSRHFRFLANASVPMASEQTPELDEPRAWRTARRALPLRLPQASVYRSPTGTARALA